MFPRRPDDIIRFLRSQIWLKSFLRRTLSIPKPSLASSRFVPRLPDSESPIAQCRSANQPPWGVLRISAARRRHTTIQIRLAIVIMILIAGFLIMKDLKQLLQVPPHAVEPLFRQIVNQFVHDKSRRESIAVGLNVVREICLRIPLCRFDSPCNYSDMNSHPDQSNHKENV